jgi:hypothetical protein
MNHNTSELIETESREDRFDDEQLTVEVPVEIRAGSASRYPCCTRHA